MLTPLALLVLVCALLGGAVRSNWREILRRVVVVHLRHELQRPVTLDAIDLNLRGHAELVGLTIYARQFGGSQLFQTPRIDVSYKPSALFASPLRPVSAVRRVTVRRPSCVINRDAAGRLEIADIIARRKRVQRDRFRGEVVIEDGEVRYADAHGIRPIGPLREHMTHLNLRLSQGVDDFVPFQLSGRSALGHAREVTVAGTIELSARHALLEVRAGAVDLGFVQRALPPAVPITMHRGHADARWQVDLTLGEGEAPSTVHMTLLADVRDVEGIWHPKGVRPAPMRIASGQVRMATGIVELVDVRGEAGGVPVAVGGTVSHFTDPVLALRVSTPGAPAARVAALVPGLAVPDHQWSGTASGWVALSGTARAMHVTGHVAGPTVRAPYGTFRNIAGDVWVDGTAVTFTNLTGQGYGGAVSGRLWVAVDQSSRRSGPAVLFEGSAADVDARTLAATFARPGAKRDAMSTTLAGITGRLSGSVSVSVDPAKRVTIIAAPRGQVALPDFAGSITGGSMRVAIDGDDVEAQADRMALALPEGTFHAHGTWRSRGDVRLTLRGSDVDLAALGLRMGRRDLAGRGSFAGTLEGPWTAARFNGSARLANLLLAGRAVPRAHAEVFGAFGSSPWVGIRDLRIGLPDTEGRLEAALRPGPDGRWRIAGQMRVRPTGIARLCALAGIPLPLEGHTDGEVTFADLPDRGQGQARVVLYGPRLRLGERTIACDEVSADISLGPRGVELSEATVLYQGTPFYVRGTMEPDPEATGVQRIAARIRAPLVSADVLRTLASDAIGPAMRLDLPIDVDGDLAVTAAVAARLDLPTGGTPGLDPESLTITGDIVRARRLEIGGVSYRGFAAEVEYRAARRQVAINTLVLNREDPRSGRDYAVSLAAPGRISLADSTMDLRFTVPEMRLEDLRRDLALMGRNQTWEAEAIEAAPVTALFRQAHTRRNLPALLAKIADAMPPALTAQARADVDVQGPWSAPTVHSTFAVRDVRMARSRLPNIAGQVSFAAGTGVLDIARLSAHADAEGRRDAFSADVAGSVTLSQTAGGLQPGRLRLTLNAQHVDPQEVARWVGNPALADFGGDADIAADISGTPADPTVIATVAVRQPSLPGLEFDGLTATLALDRGRLHIGNRFLGREHGAASLDFKGSKADGRRPLGVYGYIPLRLEGLTPVIPQDEPVDIWATLPEQSIAVAREYLPWLPAGEGKLAASLHIRGTMARPEVPEGSIRATAPELELPYDDADLPNRLRDVAMDVHVQAVPGQAGGFTNIVEVRDLSAVYDRVETQGPRKPEPQLIRWIKGRLGLHRKTRAPFTPGAVVAQGSVKLVTEEGTPIPLGDFVNPLVRAERRTELVAAVLRRLQYDVYAKTVHTPVRWRDMFQGTVTAYAHLGNRYDAQGKPIRPLVTGVVYVENAAGTYTAPTGAPPEPLKLPFDPELSVAVQVGPNCAFTIGSDNALFSSTFSGTFPFQPSDLFTPVSQADQAILARGKAAKPPVEPEHQAYVYTSDTLRTFGGTHGRITGALSKPTLVGEYVLVPRRAQAVFPRGRLTLENGGGTVRYTLGEPLSLYARGEASGQVDNYRIAATVDGNILQALEPGSATDPFERHLPISFTVLGTPKGMPPLSDDQIYTRLVGATDLVAVLEGREKVWAPLTTIGRDVLLRSSFDRLARNVGLESFTVNFATGGDPEFTATTPELGRPERFTYRLGTTREIADDPNWKLWVDLRMPQYRWLRDMGVTLQTDTREGESVSLSWRRPF